MAVFHPKDSPYRAMRRLCRQYIRDCQNRNVFWDLKLEDFERLTSSPCHYCGIPPLQKSRSYTYNGLDRVNHKLGYFLTNVVPACKKCNWVKGNRLTYEEMLAVGKALREFREIKQSK